MPQADKEAYELPTAVTVPPVTVMLIACGMAELTSFAPPPMPAPPAAPRAVTVPPVIVMSSPVPPTPPPMPAPPAPNPVDAPTASTVPPLIVMFRPAKLPAEVNWAPDDAPPPPPMPAPNAPA